MQIIINWNKKMVASQTEYLLCNCNCTEYLLRNSDTQYTHAHFIHWMNRVICEFYTRDYSKKLILCLHRDRKYRSLVSNAYLMLVYIIYLCINKMHIKWLKDLPRDKKNPPFLNNSDSEVRSSGLPYLRAKSLTWQVSICISFRNRTKRRKDNKKLMRFAFDFHSWRPCGGHWRQMV